MTTAQNTLTETANQRALVAAAIDKFVAMANEPDRHPENISFHAEPSGKKYRIVETAYGQRSVHAFVDGDTGDLLKAAGWKVAAKGARYNLLTEFDIIAKNFTWSGGYLYAGARK